MIEIIETTEMLIRAHKEDLTLYAPVGEDDQILFDSRYWANSRHSDIDIELCTGWAFGFDPTDKDSWEDQTEYYTDLDIPETATEFRAQESMEGFDLQVYSLIESGASPDEATRFAMAAVTGLPSTFLGKAPELSPAEQRRQNEFWDGLTKERTVDTWDRWLAEAEVERQSKTDSESQL